VWIRLNCLIHPLSNIVTTIGTRVPAVGHLAISVYLLPARLCASNFVGVVQAAWAVACFPAGIESQIIVYGAQGQSLSDQLVDEL